MGSATAKLTIGPRTGNAVSPNPNFWWCVPYGLIGPLTSVFLIPLPLVHFCAVRDTLLLHYFPSGQSQCYFFLLRHISSTQSPPKPKTPHPSPFQNQSLKARPQQRDDQESTRLSPSVDDEELFTRNRSLLRLYLTSPYFYVDCKRQKGLPLLFFFFLLPPPPSLLPSQYTTSSLLWNQAYKVQQRCGTLLGQLSQG